MYKEYKIKDGYLKVTTEQGEEVFMNSDAVLMHLRIQNVIELVQCKIDELETIKSLQERQFRKLHAKVVRVNNCIMVLTILTMGYVQTPIAVLCGGGIILGTMVVGSIYEWFAPRMKENEIKTATDDLVVPGDGFEILEELKRLKGVLESKDIEVMKMGLKEVKPVSQDGEISTNTKIEQVLNQANLKSLESLKEEIIKEFGMDSGELDSQKTYSRRKYV